MNILVCIKRVPATGGSVSLTADAQEIDTRFLGFAISPHEECAVEEAIQIVEKQGGGVTAMTLGVDASVEQLRDAMAMGAERAVLLETDGREWDGGATAGALVNAIRAEAKPFDLLLFGNESADAGGYQVPIRVAHALDMPCVTGVKALEIKDGQAIAKREVKGGWEVFAVPLPAVIAVKEGINLPRYPSFQGRLKAKKKELPRLKPQHPGNALEKVRLVLPPAQAGQQAEVIGKGKEAAPQTVELFKKLGVL